MWTINKNKLNNSYVIETSNFDEAINYIKKIAIDIGFDKELIDNDTHLDFRIINCKRPKEENKNEFRKIKIDEVREELINDSCISPSINDRKIYVVYDFSDVSVNIQNALLKTIEEPNEQVHFFFLTSNISTVINTIKSRSIIYFDNYDYKLDSIYDEKYIDYKNTLDLFSNINIKSVSDIYDYADDIFINNYDIKLFIKLIKYFIRDTYVYKLTFDKNLLVLKIDFIYIEKFKELINNIKILQILDIIDFLSKEINTNVDKKLALNMFFINIKNIL